ncbi:regulatory NPR3-like [Olea europaea subsp. europaea]|uniref:Regulatory NPR3-like n=1 Tax=Olea europaea subsp. europaea TaxID=158383 RepID=A0A8S0RS42_OLEEU|nr:regulatory NPR3-like [Olea europaea subsp. europaea]
MENGNEFSSSLSFASSSDFSTAGLEPSISLDLLSLNRLSASLEILLLDAEYDYSDAEIEVERIPVGVNRCILAARSEFFHELFKKGHGSSVKEGKPKYLMSELVPHWRIGYEAFMVVLNYLYTGKVMPSQPEVSTCVDESCVHDACGPAVNYAVEMMYASATFQIKELVMLVQRRLLNFVGKVSMDDIIPILMVAFHCKLKTLLSHCVQIIVQSKIDDVIFEKQLPYEVLSDVNSLRNKSKQDDELDSVEVDHVKTKRIRSIHKALDLDDVELVKLLLRESNISLDAASALHYAAAYCNPKVVNELLNLQNANVNLRNSRGYTVLHIAARRKDPLVLIRLLDQGASVLDTTRDGQRAVTICRRLTRPKDYNKTTDRGQESNEDRLCIDVLEREMCRNPLAVDASFSPMMVVDELHMKLLLLENRVAMARVLFPLEAKLAIQTAQADTTEVNSSDMSTEQVKRLQFMRLQTLEKTVEKGRRFFPNCSEVLDELLVDEKVGTLLLDKGTPEERMMKRKRYMELKDDLMKAFDKDMAEKKWNH